MAVYNNTNTIIDLNELPKFNGVAIDAIYRQAYDIRGVKDYTVRDEHADYYYKLIPYFSNDKPLFVRVLPSPFDELFNNYHAFNFKYSNTNNTEKRIVKPSSISYRTHCSGNGSFIDDSISLSGHAKIGSKSISVTRGNHSDYGIQDDSTLGKLIFNTLNIDVDVELMCEEEYTYYPTTSIRNVDNWNYPTPVCSGWRKINLMPFVSIDNNHSIRVLNELINAHVFLLNVDPIDVTIGIEYCIVNFNHNENKNYCFIKSWANNKEDNPNGMVKFRVDSIKNDIANCTVIGQDVKKFSKVSVPISSLYSISRISEIQNEINYDELPVC